MPSQLFGMFFDASFWKHLKVSGFPAVKLVAKSNFELTSENRFNAQI